MVVAADDGGSTAQETEAGDRVDCPEEPGSTMVATSFWNAFTKNIAADLKDYVVDAMKIGLIIYLEFPERRERELRDIQNAEKRLQWFEDVFRPLAESVDQDLLYL